MILFKARGRQARPELSKKLYNSFQGPPIQAAWALCQCEHWAKLWPGWGQTSKTWLPVDNTAKVLPKADMSGIWDAGYGGDEKNIISFAGNTRITCFSLLIKAH